MPMKVDFNDVVWRNTLVKQMPLEQVEQQKTFSHRLIPVTILKIIMFCRDKSVEVKVSIDQHRRNPNLILVDEATYLKQTDYVIFLICRARWWIDY